MSCTGRRILYRRVTREAPGFSFFLWISSNLEDSPREWESTAPQQIRTEGDLKWFLQFEREDAEAQ